jgi:hypothetical protein
MIQEAAAGASNKAGEIALAVAAVVPHQREMIFGAIRSTGLDELAALGLAIGQGSHRANHVCAPTLTAIECDGSTRCSELSETEGLARIRRESAFRARVLPPMQAGPSPPSSPSPVGFISPALS